MDFKRHNPTGYCYSNSRPSNSLGAPGGFAPFNNSTFPPHGGARGYRPADMNNGRLNLMHSFKNLLKLHGDVVHERAQCFHGLHQYREFLQHRIQSLPSELLNDESLELLLTEFREQIGATVEAASSTEKSDEEDGTEPKAVLQNVVEKCNEVMECFVTRLKAKRQEIETAIADEARVHTNREQQMVETLQTRERRVDKDFGEFFSDAERQIAEYEKKIRSEHYSQMTARLRSADRDISIRDQKIMQLEDNLKMVNDRYEKAMAELQQVNADHQFEKLQLYHHVELCKANSKCLAIDELLRWCKWKRCACGRDYENELLREFEIFNSGFSNNLNDLQARNAFREIRDRGEFREGSSSWNSSTCQNVAQVHPIPSGSFLPSEETENKGVVVNDLRDRSDELQQKSDVNCNYEETRTGIMKIVCHFKRGDLKVCEEIEGKKFVSTLFYCNPGDLVPKKDDKIFSTGYGDTPEEATERSVKTAYDEIKRLEKMNSTEPGTKKTFVRKNPVDGKFGKDAEPVRMTQLRSYCCEKLDDEYDNAKCLQEAYLYKNHSGAKEKYMADWKIHIRVEEVDLKGIAEKLRRILNCIKENSTHDFVEKPGLDKRFTNA